MAGGLTATLAELATPARVQKLRRGIVPAAAVLAFFLFLLLTFPYDMIARRIEVEAQRAGAELSIGSIGGRGLFGVRARDVRLRLSGAPGDPVTELRFDRVDVSPDLFALLLRRTSFGFALQAYGGSAKGHASLSSDPKLPGLSSLRLDAPDQVRLDRGARLAGVTPDHDARRPAGRRRQRQRQGPADLLHRRGVERKLPGHAADPVGPEQAPHREDLRNAPPRAAPSVPRPPCDGPIEMRTVTGPAGTMTRTRLPAGASGIGVTSTS